PSRWPGRGAADVARPPADRYESSSMASGSIMRTAGRSVLSGLLAGLVLLSQGADAHADARAEFLAGRARECPRCDLSGLNFKRRDLSGADLTGANLKDTNFHDARLAGARLGGAD